MIDSRDAIMPQVLAEAYFITINFVDHNEILDKQ